MTNLTLNCRLAALLGWANVIEIGGALLGTPPPGEYCVRNQCGLPDWAGDWRDCGPLIAEHVDIQGHDPLHMGTPHGKKLLAELTACVGPDAAIRCVVVTFVIAKLEASQ